MMIKSYKVMLVPNKKQITKLFQYANASRFAYNWAISVEEDNYRNGGKFISDSELRSKFTILRHTEYLWLESVSNNVTKQAIKDACTAYKRFFEHKSKHPKFKSRKRSVPKFFQDPVKIKFTETHVKVEGFSSSKKKHKQVFNWIRLAEHSRIPINAHYCNPRISFDGLNWWISVSVISGDIDKEFPHNEGIGIDLGIKDLAVCSGGIVYPNINKTITVKRIEKKKKRLQRRVSRKYLISNKSKMNKKGERFCKTCNIVKEERELLRLNHRLRNIRHNYLHQTTTSIIDREPRFIVMEDLNVSGMMKNKHLAKAVQQQCFYEFLRQITYKSNNHNIRLIIADRWYPSSKKCSCCGNIKHDLKLSDRIYYCDVCGLIIDRDYQASINLRNFAL